MGLNKESILQATNNGLDVFKHFLGNSFTNLAKSFKSPFYNDNIASCYVYLDKKNGIYKFKDFGDAEYSGDCFYFTGKRFGLKCDDKNDFIKVLEIIDSELCLMLNDDSEYQKSAKVLPRKTDKEYKSIPSIHNGFETALIKTPIQIKEFSKSELDYWNNYGITLEILDRYNVVSINNFNGINKEGKEYTLISSEHEPILGYQGKRHTKIYRPNSKLRFLYAGELIENYVFGLDQLSIRGDILFITGGEKDVLSLVSHGFNAICFNSETANIPKNILRGMNYRFKHITILYDVDSTGLASMEKVCKE